MRREFYPEVDAGAFEMYARAPAAPDREDGRDGSNSSKSLIKKTIPDHDLEIVYLRDRRQRRLVGGLHAQRRPDGRGHQGAAQGAPKQVGAGVCAHGPHGRQRRTDRFRDMDFSFDAGGLIRGAMNEGKSTPINIRVTGKNQRDGSRDRRADPREVRARSTASLTPGSSSGSTIPSIVIDVDRAKAADLGLTQTDVMKNVVAAFNSSIQFNKKNFWIDPIGGNQYFVGVQYPEGDIKSIETLLNIPITSRDQTKAIPLSNLDFASAERRSRPR